MEASASAKSRSPAILLSLTSLRAIAALSVVIHHTGGSWAHLTPVRWIAEVGWLGVSCFFILSGFVLMWGYDPATPASRFLLRRLFRIYPMHLLGLAVALLFFARELRGCCCCCGCCCC